MKQKTEKFTIPQSYWYEYTIGAKLCNLMHSDGQYAIDHLACVEEGLQTAAGSEKNPEIQAAFQAAHDKVEKALALLREAFYSLSEEGF